MLRSFDQKCAIQQFEQHVERTELTKRMCRKLVWASPLALDRSTEYWSKRSNVLIPIDSVAKVIHVKFRRITLETFTPFQLKQRLLECKLYNIPTLWERFSAVKIKISKWYRLLGYIYHGFYFHLSNSNNSKKLFLCWWTKRILRNLGK